MSGFSLNDTVGIAIRILQNHRAIIEWWHDTSALLQRIGLLPAGAAPAHATHSYNVEWVQQSLNTIDNAGLEVDGRYGPATYEAVKTYQSRNKLDPDGLAGMLTMASLEQAMLDRPRR